MDKPRPRVAKPGVEISTWTEQKWVRGISHIGGMTEIATAWDAAGHVWADLELSDDRFHIQANLRVDATPPLEEMALRMGDAVHNFRSALDSLAWSLCHLDGAEPKNPRGVYFPCVLEEARWAAAADSLASMPADFLERIRQVQPYLQSEGMSPLQLLVDMSNQDKHRGMIQGRANPSTFRVGLHTGGATGTRNGIKNGMRLDFLHPEMTLQDGHPFAHIETSVPVDLTHPREPIGLAYIVSVGTNEFPLGDVQAALLSLQGVLMYVEEGHWPAIE